MHFQFVFCRKENDCFGAYIKQKLPNMISLEEDGWGCNILLRTMVGMSKQKSTRRVKLMEKLYGLYKEVYDCRHF